MQQSLKDYETTKQVAERLGVSVGRVRQMKMEKRFKEEDYIEVAGRTFYLKGVEPRKKD